MKRLLLTITVMVTGFILFVLVLLQLFDDDWNLKQLTITLAVIFVSAIAINIVLSFLNTNVIVARSREIYSFDNIYFGDKYYLEISDLGDSVKVGYIVKTNERFSFVEDTFDVEGDNFTMDSKPFLLIYREDSTPVMIQYIRYTPEHLAWLYFSLPILEKTLFVLPGEDSIKTHGIELEGE